MKKTRVAIIFTNESKKNAHPDTARIVILKSNMAKGDSAKVFKEFNALSSVSMAGWERSEDALLVARKLQEITFVTDVCNLANKFFTVERTSRA